MPGATGGIPDGIPLSEVLKAPSLNVSNGDASSDSPAAPVVEDIDTACTECGGKSKSARACSGCWQVWYCSRAHQMKAWPKHQSQCRPWKITHSPSFGRYMIATRDIRAGELVLEDPPLLIGPKQITEPVCLACYRPVDGTFACPNCGFPMCEDGCHLADSHEPECKAVVASGVKVKVSLFGEINSMYECITPVRILTLRDTSQNIWRRLMSLESHSGRRGGTEVEAITQRTVVDIIIERLRMSEFDAELIQKVLGIIDTNAFEIRLPDSSIMGVFAEGALLEHSCVPNTHRTFDADLNLVVRAAVNIQRGQHLTSCYTDSLSTTASRQEHLLTSKFFTCSCPRCKDPTEIGTYTSALICPACNTKSKQENKAPVTGKGGKKPKEKGLPAGSSNKAPAVSAGFVVPKDPLSPSSPWACNKCDSPLDSDYVTRIVSVVAEEAEELEASTASVKTCETFLEKWATTLHPNHANFLNVKYALLHLYGSEEGYSIHEMNPMQILRKEDLSRQVLKVADILIPGISRLRGSVLYELYQALFFKACSMYQTGVISSDMAKKLAQDAYDCLLECARVLSFEPPVQPEGQLGLEAKTELKHMTKWMKEEGWKG